MTDRWLVISTYNDGTRVLEGVWQSQPEAIADIQRVHDFRADQDEGPVVTVESARNPTEEAHDG